MRIVLFGASGRMGQTLLKRLDQEADLTLQAAFDIVGSPAPSHAGGDVIQLVCKAGAVEEGISQGEVIIDFSAPSGTLYILQSAVLMKKAMVIGTTGFTSSEKKQIVHSASRIPIVFSSNMSVGVNVVFSLLSEAALKLGDAYDVEIVEMHHKYKKDAPSGTALRMGEVIASARGTTLSKVSRYTREGTGSARQSSEIGIQSLRGGDVVGEHTVIFAGPGERVEITHKAQSRDNFARGALLAARWVVHQPPGLYDMTDVLKRTAPPPVTE